MSKGIAAGFAILSLMLTLTTHNLRTRRAESWTERT